VWVAFGVFNEQLGTEDVIMIAEVGGESAGGYPGGRGESPDKMEEIAAEIRQRVTLARILPCVLCTLSNGTGCQTSSGKVARTANREKYLAELANR